MFNKKNSFKPIHSGTNIYSTHIEDKVLVVQITPIGYVIAAMFDIEHFSFL